MIPQHQNPTDRRPKRAARAPYNFIPLPLAIANRGQEIAQDRYHADRLTGKLSCTLTTASPIYVRAARTLREYKELGPEGKPLTPSMPTYGETEEELIIPGSSLRGMLRNLVEIVSYSRLAPVTGQRPFFRTVDDTSVGKSYNHRMRDKVRGGFFYQDRKIAWIQPCRVVRVTDDTLETIFPDGLYDGNPPNLTPKSALQYSKVYIRLPALNDIDPERILSVNKIFLEMEEGLTEGILVITGAMQNKKHEFVFIKSGAGAVGRLNIPPEVLESFLSDDQITRWQGMAFPAGKGRRRKGWLKNGDPIFYLPSEDNQDVAFFGRAYMFRLPYLHSPREMIPTDLNTTEGYDLAEALFGRVESAKGEGKAVAGRLFFSDARLQGSAKDALLVEEPITLKILGAPRPSAIQHYLTQRYPDYKNCLDHYDNNPDSETTLRGHKLYWHKGNAELADFQADPKQVMKSKTQFSPPVKPVRTGKQFSFTIYFENLLDEELGVLLWILDKAAQEPYRLKIGMGKPYGLGSVKIEASLRLTDRRDRYAKLFDDPESQADEPRPDCKNAEGTEFCWEEGELPQNQVDTRAGQARRAFEKWLLDDPAINPGFTIQHLEDLPRLEQLLHLLSWPGPDKNRTTYMDLKEFTGKAGGYDSRPVLPTPEAVITDQLPDQSPTPPPEAPCMQKESVVRKGKSKSKQALYSEQDVSQTRNKFIQILASQSGMKTASDQVGDIVKGKIFDIDSDGNMYFEIDGISAEDTACGRVLKERLAGKKVKLDQSVRVRLVEIIPDPNQPGLQIYDCTF